MDYIDAMRESLHHFSFYRLNQMLEGILYGSLGAEIPHAAECLRHPRNIWEKFGGAMSELTFKSLGEMLHAVETLGTNMCHLTTEL